MQLYYCFCFKKIGSANFWRRCVSEHAPPTHMASWSVLQHLWCSSFPRLFRPQCVLWPGSYPAARSLDTRGYAYYVKSSKRFKLPGCRFVPLTGDTLRVVTARIPRRFHRRFRGKNAKELIRTRPNLEDQKVKAK